MIREIQKYHDGRYGSIDAVYLCGEIGNPNKERLFVSFDRILEIIEYADQEAGDKTYIVMPYGRFYSQAQYIKEKVLELLEGGEQNEDSD